MIRRKRIESLVAQVLRDCDTSSPPVNVERVARSLGLHVARTEAEDHLSGFILHANGVRSATIGVNGSHAPTRQRFTIAHEIGHHLLHAAGPFHVDGSFQLRRRDLKSAQGSDRFEIEANLFAAELLMPSGFVKGELEAMGSLDLEDERQVTKLAKRFGVSVQAMTFRLANLGYLRL